MNTLNKTLLAVFIGLSVALSSVTFFTGCASTEGTSSITKADILTALEITAALTIGEDLEKAERALAIVRDARRYIGDGDLATADQVLDYIMVQALRSTDLSIAQQIAIREFVAKYKSKFTLELEQVGLDPDLLVTANEALDSIERVAVEIQTFGAAAPRTYSGQ